MLSICMPKAAEWGIAAMKARAAEMGSIMAGTFLPGMITKPGQRRKPRRAALLRRAVPGA